MKKINLIGKLPFGYVEKIKLNLMTKMWSYLSGLRMSTDDFMTHFFESCF